MASSRELLHFLSEHNLGPGTWDLNTSVLGNENYVELIECCWPKIQILMTAIVNYYENKTKAVMIRSRAQHVLEHEKSTSYFRNIEISNGKQKLW